jgi:hypothetical protein
MIVASWYDYFPELRGALSISRDRGKNWETLGDTMTNRVINEIALSPDGNLYVTRQRDGVGALDLYRMNADGSSALLVADSIRLRGFLFDRKGDVFAGDLSGAFRSTDRGVTWRGLPDLHRGMGWIAETGGGMLYALGSDSIDRAALYSSADRGASWVAIDNQIRALGLSAPTMDPGGSLFVGTGGAGLFRRSGSAGISGAVVPLPEHSWLGPVAPNPAIGRTAVSFGLTGAGHARLGLHDLLGREIAVLFDGEMAGGSRRASFDTSTLPAGMYFLTLQCEGESRTQTMIVQ